MTRARSSAHAFLCLPGNTAVALAFATPALRATAIRHLGVAPDHAGAISGTIAYRTVSSGLPQPPNRDRAALDIRTFGERDRPGRRVAEVFFYGQFSLRITSRPRVVLVEHDAAIDPELLVDDVFQLAIAELLRPQGAHVFHAASIAHDGRALMLVGQSGTGKSSTSLACLIGGASLLGDDASLLVPHERDLLVVPIAAELSVRLRSLAMHASRAALPLFPVGSRYFWRPSDTVRPESTGLRVVASVSRSLTQVTSIVPISPDDFLARHTAKPPLHTLHDGDFAETIAQLAVAGTRFVLAEIGLDPATAWDALRNTLASAATGGPLPRRTPQLASAPTATRAVAELWRGGNDASAVLPLLAHPVEHLAKSAYLALAMHPLAKLTPVPFDDYTLLPSLPAAWSGDRWHFMQSWLEGSRELMRIADYRFVQSQAPTWLRAFPVLFPFLHATARPAARLAIDRSWHHYLHQRYPPQLMLHITDTCQLRCPYCYAAGRTHKPEPPMSLTLFETLLDWALAHRMRTVALTGGEPTSHPHFAAMVDLIARKGLHFYLATNLLAQDPTRRALLQAASVEVHICDQDDYEPELRKRFEDNLAWLAATGTTILFRYNLWRDSEIDWQYAADATARNGGAELLFSFPFPSADHTNRYLPWHRLRDCGPTLTRFARVCAARGVRAVAAKPLPACILPEEDYLRFAATGTVTATCEAGATGSTRNLVVDSLRNAYPCIGLAGNSVAFHGQPHAELAATFTRTLVQLYAHSPHPECADCPLWHWRFCAAGCLSYHRPPPIHEHPQPVDRPCP